MAELKYRGRVLTTEDILYIRKLIAAHPGESRRTLSKKLCEAWQWKQPNGALRDMVCRGLLLMLDRAGEIELPPVKFVPCNPLVRRLQHAIPASALGPHRTLGVSYSRPTGGVHLRRLAADVRASDLLSGDVCGSGTIPRNLLPGGQLGIAGQDDGTRQAIQQLRPEPVDQRDFGISVDQAVSRTAGGVA